MSLPQNLKIPGFVDLQVNGYNGVDFSSPDLTEEKFSYACLELVKQGTVLFLPTVITSSMQTFRKNLELISACMEHEDLKRHLPGIHVEGPFISADEGARGAHHADWTKKPDPHLLHDLFRWADGKIKMLTIAAEPEGSEELCRKAVDLGITVSLGHQMASRKDMDRLVRAGARSLTHLGNGLPGMIHRHENPVWAGLASDDLVAMIITDGHHLPPDMIKTFIRAKGSAGIVVVSDASPVAGLPPGNYHTLGNKAFLDETGLLINPDTGYLVGSSSTMIDCMNYLSSLNLLDREELIDLGLHNPLRLIGVDPPPYDASMASAVCLNSEDIFEVENRSR